MITLKPYQQRVLDSLREFFRLCSKTGSPADAFHAVTGGGLYLPIHAAGLARDMPYVCLRVPTRRTLPRLSLFDGPKVVYCAGCLLSRDRLQAARITVRQTPYEIKVS